MKKHERRLSGTVSGKEFIAPGRKITIADGAHVDHCNFVCRKIRFLGSATFTNNSVRIE